MSDPYEFDFCRDDPETASAPESGPWVFDRDVVRAFPDMLARSIPGLDAMRMLSHDLAADVLTRVVWAHPGETVEVLDLGCSRGDFLLAMARAVTWGQRVALKGVDLSADMATAAFQSERSWRRSFPNMASVEFVHQDAGAAVAQAPKGVRGLVIAHMTLQFMEPTERADLLGEIAASLAPGGALILVEKVDHRQSDAGALVAASYRRFKLSQGYTADAIDRKDRALQGVLRPRSAETWERALRGRFDSVEGFWRDRLFAGWIATKAPLS